MLTTQDSNTAMWRGECDDDDERASRWRLADAASAAGARPEPRPEAVPPRKWTLAGARAERRRGSSGGGSEATGETRLLKRERDKGK